MIQYIELNREWSRAARTPFIASTLIVLERGKT